MECLTSLTDMEEVSNFSSRLKHDVQTVCTKLALLGEESVLLSVKLADKSSKYVGSPLGKAFLLKRLDILEDFYQFCKTMHSSEISGFSFEKDKPSSKEMSSCSTEDQWTTDNKTKIDRNVNIHQPASQNQPVNVTGFQEGDAYVIEINEDYEESQRIKNLHVGNVYHQNEATGLFQDRQDQTVSKFAQKVFKNAVTYNSELGGLSGQGHLYSNQTGISAGAIYSGEDMKGETCDFKQEDLNTPRQNTVSRRKGIFKTPMRLPVVSRKATNNEEKRDDSTTLLPSGVSDERIVEKTKQNCSQSLTILDAQNSTRGDNYVMSTNNTEERNTNLIENNKENTMKITHVWTLTGNFHSAEIEDGKELSVQNNDTGTNINPIVNAEIQPTPSETNITPQSNNAKNSPTIKWNTQKLAKDIVAGKRLIKPKLPAIILGRRETRSSKNLKMQAINKQDDKNKDGSRKKHTCNICGKSYNKIYSLRAHSNLHTGNKLCRCEICGKGFAKKKSLQTHMYLHTGDQPHACDICGKKFTLQCNLNIHKKLHSGVKPYKCEICLKEFTQLGNKRTHLKTHGNQKAKPFSCSVCDKQFMHRSTLNKHIRTHNTTYIL